MSKAIRLRRMWGVLARILMSPYRVWQWTRTINSAIFFAVYLVAIPVFAGLFTYRRAEFYHTTSKYEASTQVQAKHVADLLTNVLRNKLRVDDAQSLTVTHLGVSRLVPDGDKLQFLISVRMLYPDGVMTTMSYGAEVHIATLAGSVAPKDGSVLMAWGLKKSEIHPSVAAYHPDAPALFDDVIDESDTHHYMRVLLPMDEHQELEAFQYAAMGHPQYVSGTFGRMLYLSACTITTLGYGDIVPTSSTTRALVGSEAVLGIVLMGLFLGSATYGTGRSNGSPRKAKSGGQP